jgi:hypothetical protein
MRTMRRALSIGTLALAVVVPTAKAASAPAWYVSITPLPSNFAPAASPQPQYLVSATNVGGEATVGTVVVKALLPAGLVPSEASAINNDNANPPLPACTTAGLEVECKTPASVGPGHLIQAQFSVAVGVAPGTYFTKASASGGGASEVEVAEPVQVQANPLPFDFLPGFAAPATGDEGEAMTLSGSHPLQQTVGFGFPTENPGDGLTNDGHPRDFYIDLPRGLVGNPAAARVLCTEVQLVGNEGCPEESQVGIGNVTTLLGLGENGVDQAPLYSMVPPPGSVAAFAENVAGAGIYFHAFGEARTDSDYGITARTPDVLNIGTQPIFSVQAQLWGDPSAAAHDRARGDCLFANKSCPVAASKVPFLTMPADCPGSPLSYSVRADSWEEPSPPAEERKASYESAGLNGEPAQVEGCAGEEVAFKPSIATLPTTVLSDSPSGLKVLVHQEQAEDSFARARSPLRGATIRFPAGLAVNPSQAAGLGACSEAQIGFLGETEAGRLDFSKEPQTCPDEAKIGTLEATSPILVRRNEDHEAEVDPKGGGFIPEPLHGAVYVAQPFANPFGSLIAVYLAIEDPKTGIVAKLPAEGQLDPRTGQITAHVREAPELPVEDVRVNLFPGPRAPLITPPACGEFTTESNLTPWSAPEGKDASPRAAFSTTSAPHGGACPRSEAALPSAPVFKAGTLTPRAGTYSPLVFHLDREDGSQRLSKIELSLPTGLSAKLAGVAQCSEGDIAKAHTREVPQQGVLEQTDPSCPAASELGTVAAEAGAGPTPFRTTGHVYLAGPYKGAPLSVVAIAPAVAGPFDLGTIVVRSALYLDPVTARGRAVSDPLPLVVHGVPVDLRSLAVHIDRANFALNPTSCAQKAFEGNASSPLGGLTGLFARFQLGGCRALPYKPRLKTRLFGKPNRGAHPRLRIVLTARPGEAGTRSFAFTLPRSEFIDQGHFRTICTRVQFAAQQCPAGSVYGHVTARTPLVDYPLEGPVYLRSSSHKLPDAVAVLRGPPSQPIEIDAIARIDSVNGRLRARVETVPDAPIEKVVVDMQGGAKGLFQNSTQICRGVHRASASFVGQNGKVHDISPEMAAKCPGRSGRGKARAGKGGPREQSR